MCFITGGCGAKPKISRKPPQTGPDGRVKAFYEWSVDEKTEHDGTEIIAEEERQLYGKIVSYLSAENRFAETQISRDTLASALGTNRTYIANAIKNVQALQ